MDIKLIERQIRALAEASNEPIPMLANASAILNEALSDINWVGFYLVKEGSLLLGPFQGKVACVQIEEGRGVCGTALKEDRPQLVPDVHEFPGHIACDSASESEVVIPLHDANGRVVAVLDIDSPIKNRFTQTDLDDLCLFTRILEAAVEWK